MVAGQQWPTIQVVPFTTLQGKGAFGEGTIYLANELLNPHCAQEAIRTLTEEVGHYLDWRLNTEDALGDEGEIFAKLVLGDSLTDEELDSLMIQGVNLADELTEEELAELQAQNDHAVLAWDDRLIAVEQAALSIDSEGIFIVSGTPGETVNLNFNWTEREAVFDNEVGVYVVATDGSVDGVAPTDPGYSSAVFSSIHRHVLFHSPARGEGPGDLRQLTFSAGDRIAFYLVQDSTSNTLKALNPDNNFDENLPISFFSITAANFDGVNHVQTQTIAEGIFNFQWEDLVGGGDRDFNDVQFTAQVGDVFLDFPDRNLPSMAFQLPGLANQRIETTAIRTEEGANFANEVGFFLVDDATGRIGNLSPGDVGYASAALTDSSRVLLLSNVGEETIAQLPGSSFVGSFLIQNGTLADFLANNPDNNLEADQILEGSLEDNLVPKPIAFFSFVAANPDGYDHVRSRQIDAHGYEVKWEDLTDGGDRDFNDVTVKITFAVPPLPRSIFSIGDVTVSEAENQVLIPVTLSEPSAETVTVDFSTEDDTATENEDYESRTGTLIFAPGETTKTIAIPLIPDDRDEENETFFVTLANPDIGILLPDDSTAEVKIEDDDDPPQIFINNVTVNEADRNAQFTVSMTGSSDRSITVDFATAEGTGENAALTIQDFEFTSGTLTFAPGETSQTITVALINDDIFESDETFRIVLSNAVNASIAVAEAIGTIVDDDPVNTVSGVVFNDINGNAILDETESGQQGVRVFLDLNQNGLLTDGEPSQITNEFGQYRFDGVEPGNYLVWEEVPDGFNQTTPGTFFASVSLEEGNSLYEVNFGNQEFIFPTGTGEISGFKWEDLNTNGIRDGEVIQSGDPDFIFVLDVSGSADFDFVGSNLGDFNGDGVSNTRLDAEIAGFIALNNQLIAQGFGDTGEVGIVVFSGLAAQADMNSVVDGLQLVATPLADANANGISDVEDVLRSIRSGAFGVGNNTGTNFEVGLQRAENTLETIASSVGVGNVIFLSDGEINGGGSVSDEVERLLVRGVNLFAFGVGSNASLTNLQSIDPDAQIFTTAEELVDALSDLGQGIRQFTEETLDSFTIYLDLNQNGRLDRNEPTQVTDANGNYRFTDLAPGTYDVREVQKPGFRQTYPFLTAPPAGDGFADVVLEYFDNENNSVVDPNVVLGAPPANPAIDWLDLSEGSFVTVGFTDERIINGSGNDIFIRSFDPGDAESATADVFVSADGIEFEFLGTVDQSGLDSLDLVSINFAQPVIAVRVMGKDNLGSSFNLVSVEVSSESSAAPDFYRIELGEGEILDNVNFGNKKNTGEIRGTKWDDLDGDGIFDEDESPIAGVTIYLDLNENGQIDLNEPSQQTDSSGFYRFRDLEADTYTVREIAPLNFEQTFPVGIANVLGDGFADVVVEFVDSTGQGATGGIAPSINDNSGVNIAPISVDVVLGNDISTVDFLVLPKDSSITVGFTNEVILDRPGNDLFITEFIPRDEQAEVSVSSNGVDFIFAGIANGGITTAIDLANANITEPVRFVRILALNDGSGTPGFELANIQVLENSIGQVSPHVVNLEPGEIVENINFGNRVRNNTPPEILSTPITEYTLAPDPVDVRNFADFSDLSTIRLNGNTAQLNPLADGRNILRLVESRRNQSGSALIQNPFDFFGDTNEPLSFSTNFQFQITNSGGIGDEDGAGSDGLAFVISPTNNVGSIGGGLGYAGLRNSVAVEFDTYNNGGTDANGNHVGINLNGDARSVIQAPITPRFNNGEVWNAWIDYIGETQQLEVRVSLSSNRPADAIVSQQVDIPSIVNSSDFFVGFTSATGDGFGNHDILSWNFSVGEFVAEQQDYFYQVIAIDRDNDFLTYRLVEAPDGAEINSTTGQLVWSRASMSPGLFDFVVEVDDGTSVDTQSFTIEVTPGTPTDLPNREPVIISNPVVSATSGESYAYDVNALDPENDPLVYSLSSGVPDGILIDPQTGLIRWSPTSLQVGEFPITVIATDTDGAADSQSFTILVSNTSGGSTDSSLPAINLGFSSNVIEIGDTLNLQVRATDDVEIASLTLTANGTPLTLTPGTIANGIINQTTIQSSVAGVIAIVATATDNDGNVVTETLDVRVTDPSDTQTPTINLNLGELGTGNTVITETVDIIGSVSDNNLEFYRLEMAPLNLVNPNSDAEDPDYIVLAEGNSNISNSLIGRIDPVQFTNDTYFVRVIASDLSGNVETQGVVVNIDTNSLKPGRFTQEFVDLSIPLAGFPIEVRRVYDSLESTQSGDFGFGWNLGIQDPRIQESVPNSTQATATSFAATPFQVGTQVTLTNPDGERVSFTFDPIVVTQGGGGGLFGGFFSGGPSWAPRFIAEDGVYDTLEVIDNVSLTVNRDGTVVQGGGSILDSLFSSGSQGYNPDRYRLTTKDGIIYDYDQFAGLISVTDRNGNILNYTDNGITSSTGASVQFRRDNAGRITQIIDPQGNSIDYTYNASGDLITVSDRTDNATQLRYAQRPHYLTEVIDPLGRSGIRSEYNEQGQLVKIIDADGNAINVNFDSAASTQTITDPLGNNTTFVYDDRGNVIQQIDAEGGITRRSYDAQNNLLSETDPEGATTTFTYDDRGNVLSETDPLGNVTSSTYNSLNQVLTLTDARGNITRNTYDAQGNLLTTVDAIGNTTRFEYFENGKLRTITDAEGNETNYRYDNLGRLLQLEDALGSVTEFTYDASGNPISVTTPLGRRAIFVYDAENQLTQIVDAEGNINRFEYNAAGDQITTIDPLGNRTEFRYNDRGLRTEIRYNDGTVRQTVYDQNDRIIAEIDQNGNETQFTYDGLGRLISVTDALGNETNYTYDRNGNRVSEIDTLGRITRFEYDDLDRLIQTELPLGQLEIRTYDAMDNLLSLTNFNGEIITYEYDRNNRLSAVRLPDSTDELYTYTPTGELNTITDDRGVTQYEYDAIDQLIEQINPDGVSISYTYDRDGNISRVTSPSNTVNYTYDFLGRIATVTDRLNNLTTYAYDDFGNLIETRFANGITENRQYDSLNRPTLIQNTDNTGNLISSYEYTFDDAGNQQLIEENTGRTVAYLYDDNDRLIQETIVDPVNGNETINYSYDSTGNRLSRDSNVNGRTTYTYDQNDRLLTETTNGITTSYTYDDAGNLITTSIGGQTQVTYTWNSKGDLVGAVLNNNGIEQRIEFQYNTDGIRVSRIVNGVETRFLIDENLSIQQVLEEYNPDGTVQAYYTYGLDLISRIQTGVSFYQTDLIGSTRSLTNESGSVTDRYIYDAYGNLINQTGNTSNSYLFAGEQVESNLGLTYLRSRYYDTSTGRFISRDGDFGELNNPISRQKYLYAEANPVNRIDPGGSVSTTFLEGLGVNSATRAIDKAGSQASAVLLGSVLFAFDNALSEVGLAEQGKFIKDVKDEAQKVLNRITNGIINEKLNEFDADTYGIRASAIAFLETLIETLGKLTE